MSFLVASGHVQVDARTRDAKQDIERFLAALQRTGTQGSAALAAVVDKLDDAKRAANQLKAAARDIRFKVQLDDQATPGFAAMKTAIRDLKRESPLRLRAEFDGPTGQLLATAQAMRDLREHASRVNTPLATLAANAAAAAAALQLLDDAAGDASRALRTLRSRAAGAADAMRDLRDTTSRASTALNTLSSRATTADTRLTRLSGSTRTLRNDLDDLDGRLRRVGGSMGALRPALGSIGGGGGGGGANGMQGMAQGALLLAPALIPVAASLTAIAAETVAAGAGLAILGVALGAQVKGMVDAAQATTKYNEAVEQHGRGSVEAAKAQQEQQRILGKLPPATREAAAAFSVLKSEYKEWSASLAGDTMPVVTKSMGIFRDLLPRLTPVVRGTSAELQNMLNVLAGGMQTAGFERFMDKLASWSAGALSDATLGMVKFSQAVDGGEVSRDVEEFMDYVRANGPLVGETLGNLARALTNLVVGASDVGVSILTAANALAKLVNAVPPEVLGTIIQLYAGMKLLKLGMAGIAAASTSAAVANLTGFVRAARFGGVGPAIAGVAQRMSTLQRVGGSLGFLGIAALGINELAKASRGAPPDVDRLASSLKTLSASGRWTGELKSTFGDMDGFVAKLGKLKNESAAMEKAKPFLAFSGLGAFADTAVTKLDDLVRGTKSLGATKDDFKSLDQTLAGMATNGYANQAAEQFRNMKAAWLASGRSLKEFNAAFPEYRAGAAGLKAEQDLAAAGMGVFGRQAMDTKAKLDAQKGAADGLRASIMALNDTNRSAYDAQIGFEAAIDALSASFKENGQTLDTNTEAGRANGQAMSAAAKSHDEMLAAGLAAGDSLGSMTGKSEQLRTKMMQLATATLGSKKAATEYVNKLLGVPGDIKTMIKLERQEAVTGLQAVQAAIKATPGAKSVKVDTLNAAAIAALEAVGYKTRTLQDGRTEVYTKNGQAIGAIGAVSTALNRLDGKTAQTFTKHVIRTIREYQTNYLSGRSQHDITGATGGRFSGSAFRTNYDTGGRVQGPGTGTSDDVFAPWLSNGEWVIKAAAVAKYGDKFMASVNDGSLKLGPQMAKGGKLSDKQKAAIAAEKQRQKEGRSALTSDVTFTTAGKLAGYKNTEAVHDLGMPDSVGSLVSSINSYLGNIKKAFSGSTEKKLVSQLTSSGKALLANQKKLEGVNKALDSAKSNLEDLKGKFDSLKTSVSSSLVGFANVTKIGKYGTSAETLIKQLSSDTSRTTEFAKQLEALKGKGLNATAISDIAGAGVTGGGMATAQSLLNATPAQIQQINALQAQLQKSADAAGATTANAMYGAGLKAAEGLVKGLTSQQDKIEAAMMRIAQAMEKSIKKALGIRSPAKRMEPIGDFSAQGVEVGWEKRLAKGRTLLSGSAASLRMRPGLQAGGAAAQAPAGAPALNVTVNINSTDLMTSTPERRRVAQSMAKEINDALLDYQQMRRR
ncbi:hypothetical protein [Streptomyces sp. NBC_00258]|uniref:hypothetical protein n=1 Tax=Streptomyces sp. NBC_00258 TaxID=2903642 RepID=UPI002E2CFCD8|nr:hypothetical protein [Streptomyces sp. NBC_00258]